jgi:hypothetical protein
MEMLVDVAAVIVFLLVVPSVVWAVRTESGKEVSAGLAAFVAIFVTIMGVVFMAAATSLATGEATTRLIMLVFYVAIAIFARIAWASKPAA